MRLNLLNVCLLFLLLGLFFQSCRKKTICPAYNSAFILGEQDQLQFLSQFTNDTIAEVKENLRVFMQKNEYGIVVEVKEKKKWKLINFVPMEMVLPLVDSTLMDSTGQIPEPGFNRDQIVYNRKFGDLLEVSKNKQTIEGDSTNADIPTGKKKKKRKNNLEEEEEETEEDPDADPWSEGDVNW